MTAGLRHRLDERAVATGTTLRFILLVVLLLVASGSMMLQVLTAVSGSGDYGCLLAAGADPTQGTLQMELVVEPQYSAYQACMARFQPPPPWWVVGAWPVLLPFIAFALFRFLPTWKARRGRVVPLETVDRTGEIGQLLATLTAMAGLARTPRFVIDPAAASTGAVVFGSNRRPTICLHGGLITRGIRDPGGFRAVVLHELGHVRNRDVTVTWMTVSIWRVFLVAVLAPYLAWVTFAYITGPGSPNWTSDAPVVTRSLLLTVFAVLLITLARADVLRTREIYADRTAARWGADPRGWAVFAPRPAGGPLRRVLGSFAELWRTHPRWDLRRTSLDDPAALFDLRALPMFLTGAATAMINIHLTAALAQYGLTASWVVWAGELAAAALVTGVAGVALWRAVIHAAVTSHRVPAGIAAGLWLGLGMAAGELVDDQGATYQWLPSQPEAFLLVVAAGTVFAWWVTQCALLWIRAWRGRAIWLPMLLVLAAAGVTLASWFAWWRSDGSLLTGGWPYSSAAIRDALAQTLPVPAGHAGMQSAIAVVFPWLVGPSLFVAAAAALWVVPILAWTTRSAGTSSWVWAGVGDEPANTLPPLRRALLPGLLGALLCWIAAAGVQASLHTWRPHDRREAAGFALIYLAWLLIAVVVATAVAAIAASALVSRHRLPAALIAAGTATVAGLAGMFVLASVDGCVAPLSTLRASCGWRPTDTWPPFSIILSPALVISPFVAIVVAAAASVFGSRAVASRARENRLVARRASVAVLSVAAAGFVSAALISSLGNNSTGGRSPLTLLKPAADVSVPDQTRAYQVLAWIKFGGDDLEQRYYEAEKNLASALDKAAKSPDENIDWSPFAPICADIGAIARDAADYFHVPDPEAQEHWHTFLDRAQQGSQDCEQAMRSKQDDLLLKSFSELDQAATANSAALDRINAVTRS